MSTLIRSARIAAGASRIWEIIARLDAYADWESGYVSAKHASDRTQGIGAMRVVELKSPMGVRRATHEVTAWQPDALIAWEARDTNFPFLASARQTITLTPADGATDVENRLDYTLRYGVLGRLVDTFMFRRVVSGAAEGFLANLAERAEQTSPPP